jgi:hypothetical protein
MYESESKSHQSLSSPILKKELLLLLLLLP